MEPIKPGTQTVIEGSGELVTYPNEFAGITPEHVEQAAVLEEEILDRLKDTKKKSFEIAALLSEFNRLKLFLARGYSSFKEWADSPELADIGYRTAHDFVRIIDELLPMLREGGYEGEWPSMSTMRDILTILGDDNAQDKVIRAMEAVLGHNTRAAKQIIREIRGLSADPAQNGVVFTARVAYGGAYHKVWISAVEGTRTYDVTQANAPLRIEPRDWPRFAERFGRFVTIIDE